MRENKNFSAPGNFLAITPNSYEQLQQPGASVILEQLGVAHIEVNRVYLVLAECAWRSSVAGNRRSRG
jgi:hypothetical protein